MELTDLLTIGGAATLTAIIVQAIKSVMDMTPEAVDRFGLALAMIVGLAVTVPVAIYTGTDPASAALSGILAGASSVGVYKAAQKSPVAIEFGEAPDQTAHPFD